PGPGSPTASTPTSRQNATGATATDVPRTARTPRGPPAPPPGRAPNPAAAEALGADPGRLHKTLAASVDGRLVLAVVPVDRELDLKRLADALGGRKAVMADPAEAERATGFVVGGISPLGSRRPIPVIVNAA